MSYTKPGTSFSSPVKRGSPSSSQNLSGESPVKSRLSSSFWKKQKKTRDEETGDLGPTEFVNINELRTGKAPGRAIVFRVSLIGHVTESAGGGDCMKFHGLDSTGEIAIFVYNKARIVANKLKVNSVFKLESFDVRSENPQFPQHTGINQQVIMNENSILEEWSAEGFPAIPFNFVTLKEVTGLKISVNSRIDVLGIITEDWGKEFTRNGKIKRDIRLTDMMQDEVLLTLWEETAETFHGPIGSAIALRKAVVKEYEGNRLLNAMRGTLVWVEPDLNDDRAQKMVEWFQKEAEAMDKD